MNNKSVIAVVSLVVISFLGYWLLKTRPDQLSSPSPILSPTSTQSAFSVPGWKTCRYPDFGFDLQYPPGWIISATSNSQGGGEEPQFLVTCGDGNTKPTDIVGPLSFHPGPESTSTGDIGMQIQPQNNPFETRLHPIVSTGTTAGKESATLRDGSILVSGFKIRFGKDTPTPTRDNILRTLTFSR